jgi:hypothetical protein
MKASTRAGFMAAFTAAATTAGKASDTTRR